MSNHTTAHLSDAARWVGEAVPEMLGRGDACLQGWGSWVLLVAVLLAIVLVVGSRASMCGLTRHLKAAAFTVWLLGVAVYVLGFHEHGTSDNWVALVLRASLSAMEMFVSHSDLIEVKAGLHESATYMAVFSLVHFAAVLVSAVFVLRLLGLHVVSWLRLLAGYALRRRHYHVFWGVNDHSVGVARSLMDEWRQSGGRRPTVVFLNVQHDGGGHAAERFSFAHIFHHGGSAADAYVHHIEQLGALLFNARLPLDVADGGAGRDGRSAFDIITRVGLPRLLRLCLVRAAAGDGVDFYFLSDNEGDNIEAVMAMGIMAGEAGEGDYCALTCYCHARNTGAHRSLLAASPIGAQRIHLFDTSSLAVNQLRRDPLCHPVSYVAPFGCLATRPFEALVIGFGQTGRDALRFLYEFSALPCDAEGTPNTRRLHVVDRRLAALRTEFLRDAPALDGSADICWWDGDTATPAFWQRTRAVIDRLGCIIIAVGDDAEATRLATRLLELAYRHRTTLDGFHIRVRIRDSRKARLLTLSQRDGSAGQGVIVPFGADSQLFTHASLCEEGLESGAKRFYYEYSVATYRQTGDEGARPPGHMARPTAADMDALWQQRRHRACPPPPGQEGREEYRDARAWTVMVWYQEEQDRSNHLHTRTKRMLAGDVTYDELRRERDEALLAARPELAGRLPDRNGRFPRGVGRKEQAVILSRLYAVPSRLNSLVHTEHLRWNARMELLGYVHGAKKCYRRRTHPCLVDCLELLARHVEAIAYDEAVVRVSLS